MEHLFAPIYRAAGQLGFLSSLKGMRLHEIRWALTEPSDEEADEDMVALALRRQQEKQ